MLLNYSSIRSRSRKKNKFFQIQVIVSRSQVDIITLILLNKECLVSLLYPVNKLIHAKAKPDDVVKTHKNFRDGLWKKLKGPCGKQILYSH